MKAFRNSSIVLLVLAASLAGCGALSSGTSAETSPTRTITVQGYGEARGNPDVATVSLGVNVANFDISQAVAESNRLIASLTSAMQSLSISPADIQTIGFNVWPEDIYDQNTGQQTGEKRYHVDSSLQINIRNIADVGKVLETAINQGANNVYGLGFGIQDPYSLAAAARAAALADATQKAEEMAQDLGLSIGVVTDISEVTNGPIYPYFPAAGMGVGRGGSGQEQPPISGGQMTVNSTVSVSFEIQ